MDTRKSILCVLMALFLLIGGITQQPTKVTAQPTFVTGYERGFNDQFSVMNTNWAAGMGDWDISTGYLRGRATMQQSLSQAFFATTRYRDLDFQARMRRTGCGGCKNGIFVRSAFAHIVRFYYTNNGEYTIEKCGISSCTVIVPLTPQYAVLKGGFNTMRIVAVGNAFDFLINNKLVASYTIPGMGEGVAGVAFYTNMITGNTFDVDWAVLMNRTRMCGMARVCLLQNRAR
jgi:hypothetical protein